MCHPPHPDEYESRYEMREKYITKGKEALEEMGRGGKYIDYPIDYTLEFKKKEIIHLSGQCTEAEARMIVDRCSGKDYDDIIVLDYDTKFR